MIDTRGYVEWLRDLRNAYDIEIEHIVGWEHRVVFSDGQSINFNRYYVDRKQLERTVKFWSNRCRTEEFKRQWREVIRLAQANGRSFRERYLVNPCKNVVVDYNT